MGRRDKSWSCTLFLLSKDNKVRWHVEAKHGHPNPFSYPETIKSNGTQRQNMVIHTLFTIQRQSSLMAHRDKTWLFAPFMLSRDNQIQWHMETKQGHPPRLCHPETIKSDGSWRQTLLSTPIFSIQRQSSLMASEDKTWSSAFLQSRDNQVWWHAETKHGHRHPIRYPGTIKSMAHEDKTWSSAPSLPSRDNQVRWHAETKHGHPKPFFYP